MNKIKVLYDAARVMRDKDAYNGVIQAAVNKDEAEIFQFRNEFSKDLASGWTRATITSMVDHDGKQVRHESTTEFNNQDGSLDGRSACGRRFHLHRKHGHLHRDHAGLPGAGHKARLDHLMALLNALNNLQVVEQEDKSLLLSLDLTDMPEELKMNIQERIMHRHGGREGFLKGSPAIESGTLACRINQKYEVETITIDIKGKLNCENNKTHALFGQASINFTW